MVLIQIWMIYMSFERARRDESKDTKINENRRDWTGSPLLNLPDGHLRARAYPGVGFRGGGYANFIIFK